MRLRAGWLVVLLLMPMGFFQIRSQNDQVWISDIRANPARYWNTTVTVIGQVRAVNANPAGTTRGTYSLFDESSPDPLSVRTRDLPPVGREYVVTGVLIQDPADATKPLLDELERADPGMSARLRNMLIGGAVLFGALLVVLVFMLLRRKPGAAPQPATTWTPAQTPAPSPPPRPTDFEPTRKIEPTKPATAGGGGTKDDRTRVFMSLGVELEAEKGPDKGAVYPIATQVTNIGRAGARKNEVELSDDTVSKEQASIFYDKESRAFSINNQSTTNPTTVNGKLVSDPVTLEPDDVIQMGATSLRFRKE